MTEQEPGRVTYLEAEMDQPLIAIPFEKDGRQVVRYFISEEEADGATADDGIQQALSAAGAWSDLDWDEMEAALYRIRHENKPAPLITDLSLDDFPVDDLGPWLESLPLRHEDLYGDEGR